MQDGVCPKCAARNIMAGLPVTSSTVDGSGDVRVAVDENPDALMFKGRSESSIRAWVCGECGYTELFTEQARMMWDIYAKSRKKRRKRDDEGAVL